MDKIMYRGYGIEYNSMWKGWKITPFHPEGGSNDLFDSLESAKDFIDRAGSDYDPKWMDESFLAKRVLSLVKVLEDSTGEFVRYKDAYPIFQKFFGDIDGELHPKEKETILNLIDKIKTHYSSSNVSESWSDVDLGVDKIKSIIKKVANGLSLNMEERAVLKLALLQSEDKGRLVFEAWNFMKKEEYGQKDNAVNGATRHITRIKDYLNKIDIEDEIKDEVISVSLKNPKTLVKLSLMLKYILNSFI